MTTVNQDVETTDRIDILVTASSGTTVEPGAVTNCVINPQSRENSPFTYSISGFSGSSYTADFTDEVAGALQVTGSVAATGAWTSDKEQFTLRGSYGTKSLDLKYTAVKSKDGQIGGDGSDGDQGLKSLTGIVYLTVASATLPGTPTATDYVYSTVSFSGLTANWSLERPTITAGNANNYWESTFNATEDSSASDVSSSSTSPPNLTFSTPVRVQDGFGDSVTESVVDINAASTKWVGVDVITFTEDSTNLPHPRASSVFSYTYNNTVGNLEFAVGGANTNKSYLVTSHSFFAGDVEVARLRMRHIAEPFSSGNVQQADKIKSVYYELEVVGTPAATYSTESNYRVSLASSSSPSFVYTSSWVGSGSPTTNGFQEIQNHDMTALSGYQITIEHTPSKQLKTLYVTYTGVADSTIDVDVDAGGKT
tara:strand:+ start:146 stop:1417 length:1272 start_codon:yes stop_codon:yes gene_type:complete